MLWPKVAKAHSTSARCRGVTGVRLLNEEVNAGMVKSLPAAWVLQAVGAPVNWQPCGYEKTCRAGGHNGGPHREWKMAFSAAVPAWAHQAVALSTVSAQTGHASDNKPIALGTVEAMRRAVEDDDYYEAFQAAIDNGAATVMMLLQAEETRSLPTPYVCQVRKDAERKKSWQGEHQSSATWMGDFRMPPEVHDQTILRMISAEILSKLPVILGWPKECLTNLDGKTIEIRLITRYTGKTAGKLPTDAAILDQIDPVGTLCTVARVLDETVQDQRLGSEKARLAERIQVAKSLQAALPSLKPKILDAVRNLTDGDLSARALAEIIRNSLNQADGAVIANAVKKVQF